MCACVDPEAVECYRLRYDLEDDDLELSWGACCECACHYGDPYEDEDEDDAGYKAWLNRARQFAGEGLEGQT